MKSFIRKHLPKFLWNEMASMKYKLMDAAELMLGRKHDLVPPRSLVFVGSGDFLRIGNEFLDYFRRLGGLESNHRVLDVGCGIGRMAIPLTSYLTKSGSYEGFDIVPHGIRWCTEQITSRYPNFRFQLADIRNQEYNPKGLVAASEFRFPFSDQSFDFVFLTSVFTHMLPRDTRNYLAEVRRVLKPGGRCLITWFLLNAESRQLISDGESTLAFKYAIDGCLTTNLAVPEEAIAYEEERVVGMYEEIGLTLVGHIHYGAWCGRTKHLSYQDICIANLAPRD